jgi:predicted transcriptional regulator
MSIKITQKTETRETAFSVRMSKDLLEKLDVDAKLNGRSRNAHLAFLLKEYFKTEVRK